MTVCGQVEHVTLGDLEVLPTPAATATWNPMPHSRVMDTVLNTLDMMRFNVKSMDLTVAPGHGGMQAGRFFGTLDLTTDITDGVTLSIGIRNAVDKSFALGFCAGERVMVCSNLMFVSDITINHKHTTNVEDTFDGSVIKACKALRQYTTTSAERTALLQSRTLSDAEADSLLLRSYEQGLVGARQLKPLIAEWREPAYEEFTDRTRYNMLMAFSHLMKDRFDRAPFAAANETMLFQQFLAV